MTKKRVKRNFHLIGFNSLFASSELESTKSSAKTNAEDGEHASRGGGEQQMGLQIRIKTLSQKGT